MLKSRGICRLYKKCRVLGKDIWNITGKKMLISYLNILEVDLSVSYYLVKTGGMVVFVGTSGYNLLDARYIWMRQRIQGSHFTNLYQANQANDMMINKLIDPLMSSVFHGIKFPAHTKMMNNKHLPGNMALVKKKTGMKTKVINIEKEYINLKYVVMDSSININSEVINFKQYINSNKDVFTKILKELEIVSKKAKDLKSTLTKDDRIVINF